MDRQTYKANSSIPLKIFVLRRYKNNHNEKNPIENANNRFNINSDDHDINDKILDMIHLKATHKSCVCETLMPPKTAVFLESVPLVFDLDLGK